MSLVLNGSGSITGLSAGGLPDGSVTADDIASTLDLSGKTVTLPSGTGGKVLQVVQGKASIQTSTTSTSYVATGLNVTITPSSTSSKVLILGTTHTNTGANAHTSIFSLYRNDTTNIGSFGYQSGTDWQDVGFTMLDTPSTTSATEYEVYFRSNTGDSVTCGPNDISHYIIALEIAG